MPAKGLFHIFNRGVEQRVIFSDEQDYKTFISYLEDYLTSPKDAKTVRKSFVVNGKTFQGVPHQPKNYKDKVELVAYSLMPNHFHLLLKEVSSNSTERFIRSLCTRYSMYFNKKYERKGPLFEGPYKSVLIENTSQLSLLTRHLHKDHGYSTYPEYLSQRKTAWVNPLILEEDHKTFVEKSDISPAQKALLAEINFENEPNIEELEAVDHKSSSMQYPRFLHFLIAIVVFLVLVGIGIRNIRAQTSSVLSAGTERLEK